MRFRLLDRRMGKNGENARDKPAKAGGKGAGFEIPAFWRKGWVRTGKMPEGRGAACSHGKTPGKEIKGRFWWLKPELLGEGSSREP